MKKLSKKEYDLLQEQLENRPRVSTQIGMSFYKAPPITQALDLVPFLQLVHDLDVMLKAEFPADVMKHETFSAFSTRNYKKTSFLTRRDGSQIPVYPRVWPYKDIATAFNPSDLEYYAQSMLNSGDWLLNYSISRKEDDFRQDVHYAEASMLSNGQMPKVESYIRCSIDNNKNKENFLFSFDLHLSRITEYPVSDDFHWMIFDYCIQHVPNNANIGGMLACKTNDQGTHYSVYYKCYSIYWFEFVPAEILPSDIPHAYRSKHYPGIGTLIQVTQEPYNPGNPEMLRQANGLECDLHRIGLLLKEKEYASYITRESWLQRLAPEIRQTLAQA